MAPIASPPPLDALEQGVIEDARRRQRRRRLVGAAVLPAAALAAVLIDLGSTGHTRSPRPLHRSGPPATKPIAQPPQKLFAEEPTMGVSCATPNSIACDRVRIAVTLRRPAIAVSGTIAGEPLELDDPEWSGPLHNGRRTVFAGVLQPAGLMAGRLKVTPDRGRYYWIGSHPLVTRVGIVVDYGHGEAASTSFQLILRPGWG